ncbi:GNAT family N-acetyltransferase [Paenibacillus dokdonensis]|uniref:GNAT family N-acetyltransferase n=1 Tax=Paenibacillus dokdonensis TaxID=2567944 RepID=A0ABU6GPY1_9BACL|nr:GNAT family N-acetyltransferase [Paenibacillus dokdonensis]MEC0240326.1 GNAT family N-acetyltransferase [Paenibacillus dokdonensis]
MVTVHEAAYADKSTLRNLLELYKYDFSEFDPEDDLNENGLYEYMYLDHYWTEEGRYPFLFRVGGKLAGFALVRRHEPNEASGPVYEMAEFFVLRKFRGSGTGKQAAYDLFNRLPGRWRVAEMDSNEPAQLFWRKIIAQYTELQFQEIREAGWDGPIQLFKSNPRGADR